MSSLRMRVWITGGTGFVGSNIVHRAIEQGDEVMTTVHTSNLLGCALRHRQVDMTDDSDVGISIERFGPDLVVHCAILNDFGGLYRDRPAAWAAYVTSTAITAHAAAEVGAAFVLISTDWVFDGTQGGADEATPPNPINLYGVLKLASELVALGRGAAVARISGVNGLHRARPSSPRQTGSGIWILRPVPGRYVAGRPGLHRVGGGQHQHGRNSLPCQRQRRSDPGNWPAAPRRGLSLLRERRGGAHGTGPPCLRSV